MAKSIWWVLRTYLTNKAFLAALAFVGLLVFGFASQSFLRSTPNQSNIPTMPRGRLPVNVVQSLEDVRRAGAESEVDEIDLNALWWSTERARKEAARGTPAADYVIAPSGELFDALDEFPNLHIIRMSLPGASGAVKKLAGRDAIQYLSIGGIRDVTPLAEMRGLERIDLDVYEPVAGLAALAQLPKLKMLVLAGDQALSDQALAELAKLPHLEVLAIRHQFANRLITDAGLAKLAEAPSLQTIYVGGGSTVKEFDLLARCRRLLPVVNVQPAIIVSPFPFTVAIFPALLAMAVGFMVANQFRSPASRLAPEFVTAHAIVALGWMVIILFVIAVCLSVTRQPLLQSLATGAVVSVFAFGAGVNAVNQRLLGPAARSSIWNWVAGACMWTFFLTLGFPIARQSLAAWGLAMLAVTGIIALGYLRQALTVLRDLPAAGVSNAMAQGNQAATLFDSRWAFFAVPRREQMIESWAAAPRACSLGFRLWRWRAGNFPLPMFRFVLLFAAGAGGTLVMLSGVQGKAGVSPTVVVVLSLIMFLMGCGQIATVWRKRRTCLDVESLRPISRSVLQRDWAIALALDLLVPAILVGLASAVALQLRGDWRSSEAWRLLVSNWREILVSFAILSAVLWLVTIAVTSLATIIERLWLRVVVLLSTLTASGAAFGLLLALSTDLPRRSIEPVEILPLLWVPTVVSLIVIACMWRLWTRIDFDRRS